jgi:23S rRNA pseudouridine1911/1915/1917 synthase
MEIMASKGGRARSLGGAPGVMQADGNYRVGALPPSPDGEPDADEGEVLAEPERGDVERRASIVGDELHGQRLDKALVAMAPEFSRSHLQTLIEDGHVTLEGRVAATASRKVRAGQRLEVVLVPTAQSLAYRPETIALASIYEDEHVLVIDKPAGLVVHPAAGNWSGTLLNGLLAHVPGAAALPRAGIVHRLDKDTSGLMVVGKTLNAVTALTREIAARRVRREYRAIAHGDVAPDAFSIEAPIGRDPAVRTRMAVVGSGKPARTDVRREARNFGCSALICRLHTGRTHQIRVHLSNRGHPLLADALYGGKPALGMTRQALHASTLAFVHPETGEVLRFDARPPPDFTSAWEQVTGGAATP